jgi:hypothetical protein
MTYQRKRKGGKLALKNDRKYGITSYNIFKAYQSTPKHVAFGVKQEKFLKG